MHMEEIFLRSRSTGLSLRTDHIDFLSFARERVWASLHDSVEQVVHTAILVAPHAIVENPLDLPESFTLKLVELATHKRNELFLSNSDHFNFQLRDSEREYTWPKVCRGKSDGTEG